MRRTMLIAIAAWTALCQTRPWTTHTDPLGFTAQGLITIRRKNKRTDLAALAEVIGNYGVVQLVVGLPLRMSGAEGRQSEKMREFVAVLQQRFALPIHLWDERLTSVEANRVLRETEMSIKKRAAVVDQLAAVLILQNWMEARLHPLEPLSGIQGE